MNDRDAFDRLLHDWIADAPARQAPAELVDAIAAGVRARQPRPAWVATLRGDGMDAPVRLGSTSPRPLALGLLVALVVAIAGGLLVVGGLAHPPRVAAPGPSAASELPSPFAALPALRPVSAGRSLPVGPSDGVARRFGSDGTLLWVGTNAAILGIDPASATIQGRITPPPTGTAFAFTVTPGSVWVVDRDPVSITRYDTRTGRSTAVIAVPTPATWIESAAGAVWIGSLNAGTVTRIDPATNRVVATIQVAAPGIGTRPVAGGDDVVWIGLPPTGSVVRVDPSTNVIVATMTVSGLAGAAPDAVQYAVDGHTLWALANTDQGSATLTSVDVDTSATIWTTRLKGTVSAPIVRSDAIWVELDGGTPDRSQSAIVAVDRGSGRVLDALLDRGEPASDLTEALGSIWATRFGTAGGLDQFPADLLTVQTR